MLQLAAARPQELVGKVIGRGVFNRSHYTHYTRVTLIIIIHKTDCSPSSFAFNFSPPFFFSLLNSLSSLCEGEQHCPGSESTGLTKG